MTIHNFMISNRSVTLVLDDGPRTITEGQDNYEAILQALRDKDMNRAAALANPAAIVRKYVSGRCEVVGDQLYYKGKEITGYLVDKIFEFARDDLPWEHLVTFMDNLQNNPSARAREELYRFLETENMPVTEDGHFLAYKAVRADWTDCRTGTIDNSVGQTVTMERRDVNDDQAIGCSHGLHAGSLEYVRGFHQGGHVIIVKINPQDVVCIPTEDVRKLRCCRYEVLKEMDAELLFPSYSTDGSTHYGTSPLEKPDIHNEWDEVRPELYSDIQSNIDNGDFYQDDEDDDLSIKDNEDYDPMWDEPTVEIAPYNPNESPYAYDHDPFNEE